LPCTCAGCSPPIPRQRIAEISNTRRPPGEVHNQEPGAPCAPARSISRGCRPPVITALLPPSRPAMYGEARSPAQFGRNGPEGVAVAGGRGPSAREAGHQEPGLLIKTADLPTDRRAVTQPRTPAWRLARPTGRHSAAVERPDAGHVGATAAMDGESCRRGRPAPLWPPSRRLTRRVRMAMPVAVSANPGT
jgi:hypothetical protein